MIQLLKMLWPWLLVVSCWGRAEVLVEVADRLEPADIVVGEFRQTQQVAALSRPLVSRGRFVFMRGAGILWEVREPFLSTLVLGAEGDVSRPGTADSQAVAGARALGFVARLLNHVLAGNLQVLEDSFQVRGDVEAERWSLFLEPRGALLHRVIDSVELQGGAVVERVSMRDANGDQSVLVFSRVGFPPELPAHASLLKGISIERDGR